MLIRLCFRNSTTAFISADVVAAFDVVVVAFIVDVADVVVVFDDNVVDVVIDVDCSSFRTSSLSSCISIRLANVSAKIRGTP